MTTTFHGSAAEGKALNVAAWHHCTCESNGQRRCPTHAAMINNQRFMDGLLFARRHWASRSPGAGQRVISMGGT